MDSHAMNNRISTRWVALFTVIAAIATLAFGCAMPFAAMAVLAARELPRRAGLSLMLLCWMVSQVVGFGLLHYPRDAGTLGWSIVVAIAALAALPGAGRASAWAGKAPPPLRIVAACLGAFVAFKLVVLAGSLVLGGTATLTAPGLLARQLRQEGLFLIGLLLVHRGLVAAGVPSARPAAMSAA